MPLFELNGIPEIFTISASCPPTCGSYDCRMCDTCYHRHFFRKCFNGSPGHHDSGSSGIFCNLYCSAIVPHTFWKELSAGSGLPVILGVSFGSCSTMQSIAMDTDIGTVLSGQLAGGCIAIIAGLFMSKLRRFFPPMVTELWCLQSVFLSHPTAIEYMAGGRANPDFGSTELIVASSH